MTNELNFDEWVNSWAILPLKNKTPLRGGKTIF